MNFHTKAITEDIIYRYAYGIQEVKEIEELGTFSYTNTNIRELTLIIKKGDYASAELLEKAKDLLGEDLTLFRFKDQDGKLYYAFYYDSIEPWQNPIVMDLFPEIIDENLKSA